MEGAQASHASILPTSVWESEEDARKAAGACSEALRRLKTTLTAGEGGPVSQRPPQDGLQSLSDGTVNIRTGLADVGGRTGENDIGKPGEGGYSLQMRVAHLVQQHQRLLELGNPALEPLFTEGGPIGQLSRENPSRVTGTSGGSGERDATQPLRDKEEGPVEAEANRGTEGPFLSTMWSAAAERSPGGPTRKPNYWFVRSGQCTQ